MANRFQGEFHGERRQGSRVWYLLLLLPFIALLWPSFYAKDEPRLGGFPFFYWYQFLWVIVTALLTGLVYVMTTPRNGGRR